MTASIFVCENQPVLVEGLRFILEDCNDLILIGQSYDLIGAIEETAARNADIFLLGQPFGQKSIIPLATKAREAGLPSKLVLWVSELSEMDTFRALQTGARGIIKKTQIPAAVIECLRAVSSGSVYLESALRSSAAKLSPRGGVLRITPREREIVEYICKGLKNKEIAQALSITPGTVKVHLMHIFEKTGVKDRFQLALQGRQLLETAGSQNGFGRAAEA